MEITETALAGFLETILPHLDERRRRLLVGATAVMLGRGGRTKVAELSGVSRPTVAKGANEIETGAEVFGRQRSPGGGAKPAVETQPGLFEALDALVDPQTRGSPVSSLRWTSKSTCQLADELVRQGYRVSAELVRHLFRRRGLSSFLCEVVVHVVGSRRPGKVMANALSACFHPWVPVPSSPPLLFPMLRIAK